MHPNYQYLHETGEALSRLFGCPICTSVACWGFCGQQVEPRAFDDAEVSLLTTLSAQLAAEVAHAQSGGKHALPGRPWAPIVVLQV